MVVNIKILPQELIIRDKEIGACIDPNMKVDDVIEGGRGNKDIRNDLHMVRRAGRKNLVKIVWNH